MTNWYVLLVKPRAEKKVRYRLHALGITVYAPMRKERRQWSDRIKTIEAPLLPSMVLVQVDEKDRHVVFEVSGVVQYLFYQGQPAIVRDGEVNILKSIETKGSKVLGVHQLEKGDDIQLKHLGTEPLDAVVSKVNDDKCWLVLKDIGYVVVLPIEEMPAVLV